MLVINRSRNEKICIGDNIVITITKIFDGSVKIGIDAPKEIPIVRGDLSEGVRAIEDIKDKIDLKPYLKSDCGANPEWEPSNYN